MKIGILGAGIVGLNTALQVQTEFPNAQVSVIAQSFGNDTLSCVAAGIFHPGKKLVVNNAETTEKVYSDAYNFYNDILQSEDAVNAGVIQVSGYELLSKDPLALDEDKEEDHEPYMKKILPIYRAVRDDELSVCSSFLGTSWKQGMFYQTMVITTSLFLPWASEKFQNQGGQMTQKRIENFSDLLEDEYDYVVNCTGLGARWLCDDQFVKPVRGQVYKVKAPWVESFYYGDDDTYIIPGSNIVTLGGCWQLDNYSTELSSEDSIGIWDRCTNLLPLLSEAEIVRECAGLRPYRETVRCGDPERLKEGMKEMKLIHQYGHGSYGVTSAPGTAIYCTKLLKEMVRSGKLPHKM